MSFETFVDQIYGSQERLTRDEIQRRAVVAELPAETLAALDALPEGEYAYDEVTAAVVGVGAPQDLLGPDASGVPADQLSDEDLFRELKSLHRTRNETLRHGSDHALDTHTQRQDELEEEYVRRFPQREIDPERERAGARALRP
jgi:hypothetical protein